MNKFEAMRAFCLVAERGSFASAAEQMSVSATMISRYVKQLEQSLGCLLLKRNTRKVFLTDAGSRYLQQIQPLLFKISQVEQQVSELGQEPAGKLTISASIEFGGLYLAPLIDSYRNKFPKVALEFTLTNTPVDLFDSGIDLVFRVAPALPNASHIAQAVCTSKLSLWASPEYLLRFGTPESPQDLHQHKLLFFKHSIRKDQWLFTMDGQQKAVRFNWDWMSDNGRLLNEAAAKGMGIIQAPGYSVAPWVQNGELQEIMPAYGISPLTISAIYPHRYDLSNRVKTFVEVAKDYFKDNSVP
ncbi:LysR family transcriptional regulator [Thalassomonas viridans]|uniref:LysR family transcriptional regulator n=1 Tax=Thalassomonas viridans TaxID=137584 RepID=A0AAE9Z9A5_9GAMM|nr:LysR family transcriptional regulator [Thalassomonas viridans]WDE09081.1 LysR family transcriptional regulator [Thalassomonas viridans]